MGLPVVQGVAPELPVLAEVIRRHARDVARAAFLVELQDVAVRPGIGAVQCDTDRHVAEQAHTVRVRVVPQHLPLVEEQALDDLDMLDFERRGFLEFTHGGRFATHKQRFPFGPGALAVPGL